MDAAKKGGNCTNRANMVTQQTEMKLIKEEEIETEIEIETETETETETGAETRLFAPPRKPRNSKRRHSHLQPREPSYDKANTDRIFHAPG